MVENLLKIYKTESQTWSSENQKVDLCEMLERVIKRNEINAQQKECQFNFVKLKEKALIDGKNHSIERVVQNLLDNAFKFVEQKGTVEVKLARNNNHYEISVKDNGPGIEIEDQKHLFDRFWQGKPGKKYTHGTGLGLYLCKQIVEAHRGKITCKSTPKKGTTFTVTLPSRQPTGTDTFDK